jgi:hypothetical protein
MYLSSESCILAILYVVGSMKAKLGCEVSTSNSQCAKCRQDTTLAGRQGQMKCPAAFHRPEAQHQTENSMVVSLQLVFQGCCGLELMNRFSRALTNTLIRA